MTVRELVDRIETNLRMLGLAPPGDADILMYLNDEHRRIARELRIPRRYITDVDATQPFAMPDEALPGSLSFAEKTERSQRIEILTVAEANDLYPDWERNEFEGFTRFWKRLIIYDPANITAPVYPVGFEVGDTLRLEYAIKPPPLVFDNPEGSEDVALEPFQALMPEYHRILHQMVTFQIAMMMGNQEQVGKARAFYQDAQNDLNDAFSYARPMYHFPGFRWAAGRR
jgi:hypothetical protein